MPSKYAPYMKQLLDKSISSYALAETIGVSASAVRGARYNIFNKEHAKKVRKKWRREKAHVQNEINRTYRARSLDKATNFGDEWTDAEDLLVLTSTMQGLHLAEYLGRTLDAIYIRRARLKAKGVTPDMLR